MTATASPRLSPSLRRPSANARTSSLSCAQVQVCQIPRSLWRSAGREACCTALRNSSLGTVSGASGEADTLLWPITSQNLLRRFPQGRVFWPVLFLFPRFTFLLSLLSDSDNATCVEHRVCPFGLRTGVHQCVPVVVAGPQLVLNLRSGRCDLSAAGGGGR